jgi:hypothetical protein
MSGSFKVRSPRSDGRVAERFKIIERAVKPNVDLLILGID